jgi:hypothetical protein
MERFYNERGFGDRGHTDMYGFERGDKGWRGRRLARGLRGGEVEEGTVTRQIETVTSRIPSGTFLSLAFGAIGISAFLQAMGRKDDAQFVGEWVPTILILGLYNKLVKLEGLH